MLPGGHWRSGDLLGRCGKESLSLHDYIYEIVNSPPHGDGQGYVRPNNAGVGVEEGVGVRQVSVQLTERWMEGGEGQCKHGCWTMIIRTIRIKHLIYALNHLPSHN